MARVFVTGASGFIGGALTTRLLERGDEVVGLARSDAAAAKVAALGAEVARGDLLDEESIAAGMAGCEAAYHVAGVNSHCPSDPGHAAESQRGRRRSRRTGGRQGRHRANGRTSSAASLGEPAGTVGTEDCTHRGSYLSVYDRSKHEGERAVFAAAAETGVEVVAVNPSSVQGPPRTGGNGAIIIAYLNGKLPAFVDTQVSVVGHPGLRRGPPLGGRAGRERAALRAKRRHPVLDRGAGARLRAVRRARPRTNDSAAPRARRRSDHRRRVPRAGEDAFPVPGPPADDPARPPLRRLASDPGARFRLRPWPTPSRGRSSGPWRRVS